MTTYSDPGGGGSYGAYDTTTPTATWLYGSFGYPTVDAVNQGGIGDCWFESSLMCMATFDPNYLESMITADGNGYYTVRMYVNGTLTPVTIGDDLPNGASYSNGDGEWASLIEKAYAAVQGSYTAMNGNTADTAFRALTGQSCTDLSINSGDTSTVDSQLRTALGAGKGAVIYSDDLFVPQTDPLYVTPGPLSGNFPAIDYNSSAGAYEGLVLQFDSGAHAYAVVGYDATTGDLIVRNPWDDIGSTEYSKNGVTFPNAYVSNGTDSTDGLVDPNGNGNVEPGYNIHYFSEFEISANDLQYFYGGAITSSPLPSPQGPNPTPNPNNLAYSSTASGYNHFIDLLNFEASFADLIFAFGTDQQAMQKWYAAYEPQEQRVETFDGLDYVASSRDLINAFGSAGSMQAVQDDGATHYMVYGLYEGRSITFNDLDYIASYSDLIKAFGANNDAGAYHYIAYGSQEGRTTTFDGLDYIASYSDLIKAFGANNDAGATHFIDYGYYGGRTTTFDGLDYIASYSDLIKAFGANNDAGAVHFINYGYYEGRGTAFDGLDYIASYSDLIKAFGANNDAGATHFIDYGYNEGRGTAFDGLAYIADYTDLMKAFGANNNAGATHYIDYGYNEGRATTFNMAAYESKHPDLIGKYATKDQFLTAYINTYDTTGHFLT
jgi:hypothetical protein